MKIIILLLLLLPISQITFASNFDKYNKIVEIGNDLYLKECLGICHQVKEENIYSYDELIDYYDLSDSIFEYNYIAERLENIRSKNYLITYNRNEIVPMPKVCYDYENIKYGNYKKWTKKQCDKLKELEEYIFETQQSIINYRKEFIDFK